MAKLNSESTQTKLERTPSAIYLQWGYIFWRSTCFCNHVNLQMVLGCIYKVYSKANQGKVSQKL